VSDGQATNATSTSTLDITVTAVNDAPIATPATLTGTEDTNLPVNLAGTDLDGTIASVTVNVLPPASEGVLTKADGSPVVAGVALTPSEAATLIFKPALNFNGAITPIEFKVTDNQGLDSATALVNISLSAANDAPIATPVTPIGDEDTPITINFGGTDVEDGTPATVTITSLPPASKGVLYLADGITPVAANTPVPAGDLIFKPALNYNTATDGPLVIPFTVTDSGGLVSTPANASITINALNDAPTATPATLTVNEDTPITVSLAGTDVDGTITSVTVTELPPANEGVLTKADGSPVLVGTPLTPAEAASLVFTPALNFNGPVTPIKFTVKDNLGIDSTPATSTITVTAVNDAPIATPVTPSGDEDTPITVNLAGTDVDGTVDTVTVTALPPATKGVLYLADGTTPVIANVPLTAAQAASLIFTPAPNYNTAVDGPIVVPFKVTDNNGAVSTSSTASITVNDVNDVPVATSKSVDTPEDTNVGVNLSGTDIDGTVTSIAVTQLPDPAEGILYFADGVTPVQANVPMTPAQAAGLIFNPTANYNSTEFNLVEIKFTVTDDDGGVSVPGTFVVDIADVNDEPIATAVTDTTPEDTPLTIVLGGTDIDALDSVTSVSLVTLPSPAQGILYLADGTTLVVAGIDYPPGSFVFKPAPNFNGTVPPFNFTVKDTVGQVSAPAAISLSIGDVNDLPTAVDALITGVEDTPVSVSLMGNDIDGTIASVTITALPPAIQGVLTLNGVAVSVNQVLSPTEAANLVFTPAADTNGAVTPILFTVTDDDGGISPVGTATITITPVNDPPVATTATAVGDEDTPIPVALTGTDVEDITPATVTITSLPPAEKGVLTLNGVPVAANQVLTSAEAILLVFTPTPNSNGTATFTFTVTDSEGSTSPAATATINVTPVNDVPIATPTTPSGAEDTPIPVSLTGTDVEGPIVSITITALPPTIQGVLTLNGVAVTVNQVLSPAEAANLIFTPAADFNGPVTPITFTVQDSSGADSPPASAAITVTAVNDPPAATPATATGNEDTPINIALTGTDFDGSVISIAITSLPPASQGVLTLNGVPVTAGQILTPVDATNLVFTPALNSNGTTTFTFTVTDNQGLTSPAATATVNVTPVNDVPVATPATPIGNEDTPIPVSLTGTDVEGPIASVTVTAVPPASEGVLTKADGTVVNANDVLTPTEAANLIFTPAANFNGPVTPISFTVTDSNGTESPPATSTITVIDVVNPPVATPVKISASSEQAVSVKLSGSDRDGTIASVTIKSLPPASEGILTLPDGTPVSVGQVLTPAQAASLRFKAKDGFNGTSNIGFTVTDDEGLDSAIGNALITISSDNGLFEQLVSQPIQFANAEGSSDGNPIFGASSFGSSPPYEPAGTPVTDGLVHTNGLVSQANNAGVFSADNPTMNEINSYSSDLNTSAQGTSQGLFVQHAVRGLPVTSEANIFVQNAVRQSQIESQARHVGVNSLNTATNAVTSLIMPFELGAPNHIETDFTVQGAFDSDGFKEELKKKTSQVDNQASHQEVMKTLSNMQLSANQDAVKMQSKLMNPPMKDKQKSAASSFAKQIDMANNKLKSTRIFGA
jgi:large repetitive protein